jgi:hypothetical protein
MTLQQLADNGWLEATLPEEITNLLALVDRDLLVGFNFRIPRQFQETEISPERISD